LNKYKISGITLDGLNEAARAAADPDYKGYYEYTINEQGMKMEILMFVWYNKNLIKYESMCDYLEAKLDLDYWIDGLGEYMSMGQSEIPPGTIEASSGTYDFVISGNKITISSCSVQYYLKKYQEVPKDTLAVGFSTISY